MCNEISLILVTDFLRNKRGNIGKKTLPVCLRNTDKKEDEDELLQWFLSYTQMQKTSSKGNQNIYEEIKKLILMPTFEIY